jgi:hypothetical protein
MTMSRIGTDGKAGAVKMCWKFGTIGVFASVIGAFSLASLSVEAQTQTQVQTQTQTKKKKVATNQSGGAETNRPKTRVTVPARSFLDAGTNVLPGERKFNDYAFPPGYSVLDSSLGPGRDFRRQPLNDPWDIPGSNKF